MIKTVFPGLVILAVGGTVATLFMHQGKITKLESEYAHKYELLQKAYKFTSDGINKKLANFELLVEQDHSKNEINELESRIIQLANDQKGLAEKVQGLKGISVVKQQNDILISIQTIEKEINKLWVKSRKNDFYASISAHISEEYPHETRFFKVENDIRFLRKNLSNTYAIALHLHGESSFNKGYYEASIIDFIQSAEAYIHANNLKNLRMIKGLIGKNIDQIGVENIKENPLVFSNIKRFYKLLMSNNVGDIHSNYIGILIQKFSLNNLEKTPLNSTIDRVY